MLDVCIRLGLERLVSRGEVMPLTPALRVWLRKYVESQLRAGDLSPTPIRIAMLIADFVQLVALSRTGKPILHRKCDSLSLLFDVFSLQSEMSLDDPDTLVLGYTQAMMGFLLFHPEPAAIGMVGLGGGSLAKFCYRHLPRASIDVAEIEPQVIALREHFRIPPDDDRFRIHCMNGADFVREAHARFDVLLIDGFDRDGQPPQLCSRQFYGACRDALTADGIMAVNLLGDAADTATLIDRIDEAFDGAAAVVDAPDACNKIVFAGKGERLNLPEQVFRDRVEAMRLLPPAALRAAAQGATGRRSTTCEHVPPESAEREALERQR